MEKKYLIVSEEGTIGVGIGDPDNVLALLLHAYLSVCNKEKFNIDVVKVGEKIIDMIEDFRQDDSDIDLNDLLEILFWEDICDDN
ncbi:MAG: hypothetical protein J6Q02_10715 [Lachnospiraceae bacterium]|nr:hypothetical protein [Lachnospiraceae bacterium]